jgi:hypothetical protein
MSERIDRAANVFLQRTLAVRAPRIRETARRRRTSKRALTSPGALAFAAAVIAVLFVGWRARHLELLTGETGAGYALGVVGGLLILSLLLYPLRKRWRRLRHLGRINAWFRVHMTVGVIGPVCILFHANFSFGSTNSNVALISMLTVVASGIAGRYLYAKVHDGLYGHHLTLEDLRDALALDRNALTSVITSSTAVLAALGEVDKELEQSPRGLVEAYRRGRRAHQRARALRWVLAREVPAAVARTAASRKVGMIERFRARRAVRVRARRYVRAVRAIAFFSVYERALSAWHFLHVPLFVLLLFAGIVHVIAVHAY